jgi:hypothetical protein
MKQKIKLVVTGLESKNQMAKQTWKVLLEQINNKLQQQLQLVEQQQIQEHELLIVAHK